MTLRFKQSPNVDARIHADQSALHPATKRQAGAIEQSLTQDDSGSNKGLKAVDELERLVEKLGDDRRK